MDSRYYKPSAWNARSGRITPLKGVDECRSVAASAANLVAIVVEELLDVLSGGGGSRHVLGAAPSHPERVPSPEVGSLRCEARLDSYAQNQRWIYFVILRLGRTAS